MAADKDMNYYDLLEVSPEANEKEIWGSYTRMRGFYSSDPEFRKEFSDSEAKAFIQLLDEAYETLCDEGRRREYDRIIGRVFPNAQSQHHRMPDFVEDTDLNESITSSPNSSSQTPTTDELQSYYPLPSGGADGDYIRQLREDAGLSCEEVSAITRIAVHHIESIEADKLESLPAPVFVRGFITQIAKTFGLNEKMVSDSYMARFKRLRD